MNIKVIYRNYIPLYSGYCSFWLSKIPNINFIISKPNLFLKNFYLIYRKISGFFLTKIALKVFQKVVFSEKRNDFIDAYFYTGILPSKNINKPYVIDFEHIYALFDYSDFTKKDEKRVLNLLTNDLCIKILPWSLAAKSTLQRFYLKEYKIISHKVQVLYPALPNYSEVYRDKTDWSIIKNNKNKKFLFVGREYKRKGLPELLEAFVRLSKECSGIELFCVSDIPKHEQTKYKSEKIKFYPVKYSHSDLIKKFFLPADVFVLPTHADTFGMVIMEALSSGLPVITTNQFAAKEIVVDKINGLLLESDSLFLDKAIIPSADNTGENYQNTEKKLVANIYKKLNYLCHNWNLVSKMSKNSISDFAPNRKFSLEKRNAQIKDIFLNQ